METYFYPIYMSAFTSIYTDEQAVQDGVFVDVTPKSCRTRVVVTPSVKLEFSMAAIMEMFNSFVQKFNDPVRTTHERQNYYSHEKMNGKVVVVTTCILGRKEGGDAVAIKMYFPHEA